MISTETKRGTTRRAPEWHLNSSSTCGKRLEYAVGDIAGQRGIDAVVNAANAQLMPGGGVAGALHRAAGPGLAEECRPLAPIRPGEAVITSGHRLPNRFIIHVLGPVFGTDHPEPELLANCYRNALQLADQWRVESIAFPAISTGAFGYPFLEASEVACRTVLETLPRLDHLSRLRFVFLSELQSLLFHTLATEFIREMAGGRRV